MRRLMAVMLVLGVVLSSSWLRAESAAEVLDPEDPPKKEEPKAEPRQDPPAANLSPENTEKLPPSEKLPLVIDEPDFKAKAVFPEQPTPKFDQSTRSGETEKPKKRIKEWSLPREEGETAEPEEEDPQGNEATDKLKEEISPALAKAIARDKPGKKPKEQVELYKEVAGAEPQNAAAAYRLGLALVRNGQLKDALDELEKARTLKPDNPKYQCDFGLAALQIGWLEKALLACDTAARAIPAEPRFQSALGDCLLTARRYNEAVAAYSRAIGLTKGRNPDYIYNLGLVYLYAHTFRRAIEVFDEAITLRNDYPPYYCSRGLAHEYNKNIKQAIADYSAALKLDKNNAYAHYLLAGVYSDPTDPTYTNRFEALEHSEKAVKLTQFKNARYLMGLARALRVCHNYDEAVIAAKKAVDLDPREDYRQELAKLEQMRTEGKMPR